MCTMTREISPQILWCLISAFSVIVFYSILWLCKSLFRQYWAFAVCICDKHSCRYEAVFNKKLLIFFLFLHENICCGYSLEASWRGASNEFHNITFSWRNKKKYPKIIAKFSSWTSPVACKKDIWNLHLSGSMMFFVEKKRKWKYFDTRMIASLEPWEWLCIFVIQSIMLFKYFMIGSLWYTRTENLLLLIIVMCFNHRKWISYANQIIFCFCFVNTKIKNHNCQQS